MTPTIRSVATFETASCSPGCPSAAAADFWTPLESLWVREAREEGREEAIRSSIATFRAARGLTMSPQQRAVLDGCRDVAMLERWVTQAALAATVEEALR